MDAKLELGKHHFEMGREDAPKVTTHQRIFEKKVNPGRASRAQMNKINLGEGLNPPMHTTTHAEFTSQGFSRDTKEESILYSKLRKVNIQYGEHVPIYESASRKYGTGRNGSKTTGMTSPLH